MATAAPPIVSPSSEDAAGFTPFVPASSSPAELTLRALLLGAVLGVVFAASSVYLALKVGLTVSASIPIAVLAGGVLPDARPLDDPREQHRPDHRLGRRVDRRGRGLHPPGDPAHGLRPEHRARSAIIAVVGGMLGILLMIPLRRALIVKEHGNLTYPEGTACAEVLIAGEKGGLQARLLFQAFGLAFVYKFLMAGLKLWKEYPDQELRASTRAASISAEVSPGAAGRGLHHRAADRRLPLRRRVHSPTWC